MRKLAREFTLSFRSKTPPSLKHYLLLCWWPFGLKPDWEINHIEGIINDHRVHIFDNLFSGPWFFFLPINYLKSHTTIEVDGEYLKGKEKIYKPFTLGDAYLTSVYELRRFLTKTKIQKDK